MKIFYLLLLLTIATTQPNIFLHKPEQLSLEQIEELAQDWETRFSWDFARLANFTCCYQQGKAGFLLTLLGIPIRPYNYAWLENMKRFIKSTITFSQEHYYFAEPLQFDEPSPKKLTTGQLCHFLKDKTFIFYTGAGISVPTVASMHGLMNSLKLNDGKTTFLKAVFLHPKTIADAFTNFCKAAIYSNPTPAHDAIAQIAVDKNICIITENVDLLQHRTGSRPIHAHTLHTKIKPQEFQEIDAIICVGLHHDDRGLLAYYKTHNPNGIIIAINIDVPQYLSSQDFLVQADAQVILPKLAHFLHLLKLQTKIFNLLDTDAINNQA